MAAKPETQTPSSAIVAQRLAERAARAAVLVVQIEAERAAGLDPDRRALVSFRWDPLDPADPDGADCLVARLVLRGASGEHHVKVAAVRVTAGPFAGRVVVEALCDCPDHWGHTWAGACKHELVGRALVSRALEAGCGPRPPEPPETAAVAAAVAPQPGTRAFAEEQARRRGPALVGVAAERAAARAEIEENHGLIFPRPEAA